MTTGVIFLIILILFAIFIYLLVRGASPANRNVLTDLEAEEQQKSIDEYYRKKALKKQKKSM